MVKVVWGVGIEGGFYSMPEPITLKLFVVCSVSMPGLSCKAEKCRSNALLHTGMVQCAATVYACATGSNTTIQQVC